MNVQDLMSQRSRVFRDHDLHAGPVFDHGELDAMLRRIMTNEPAMLWRRSMIADGPVVVGNNYVIGR